MVHYKSDKCLKCDKLIVTPQGICSQCSNPVHIKCNRMNKKSYLGQ